MADALRARWPGGIRRLDWLLTRYWDALEADLTFRGVDLLALFQDCRVRLLLNLIEKLPRASLTGEVMSQDDELVEQVLRGRDPDELPAGALRLAEFTPEVEALLGVVDRLGDVVSATVASGGRRPPRIPPAKRPETAWDRARHRWQVDRHRSLVARVLPHGPLELPGG